MSNSQSWRAPFTNADVEETLATVCAENKAARLLLQQWHDWYAQTDRRIDEKDLYTATQSFLSDTNSERPPRERYTES